MSNLNDRQTDAGFSGHSKVMESYLEEWLEKNENGEYPCEVCFTDSDDFISLQVPQHVFNPNPEDTYSSSIVLDHIPPELSGKTVLDMGTGSGVLTIHCLQKGAKNVLATDVCKEALDNAKYNVGKHGKNKNWGVSFRESNLFGALTEKFDLILANLPIFPCQEGTESSLKVFAELLSDLPKHLKPGGKLLLPQAEFGEHGDVEAMIKKSGFHYERKTVEKFGFPWYLFIVSLAD